MNTTAVFVELLIGGIQAFVWISLLLVSFTGYNWVIVVIQYLEKWETLITVVIFAIWYTTGIIVDRFSRLLFIFFKPSKILRKIKLVERYLNRGTDSSSRLELFVKTGKALDYLEYFRSRGRIIRLTIFNLLLITISAIIFVITRCNELGCASNQGNLVLIILGIGLALIIITSIASAVLELAYGQRFKQVELELEKANLKSEK